MPLNRIAVLALLLLSLVVGGGSAPALAASAAGCPAWGNPGGNPGMTFTDLVSIEEAVALSVAQITDAWYEALGVDKEEFLAARIAHATESDKNGDGLVCVAQNWGQDLNPNSHWRKSGPICCRHQPPRRFSSATIAPAPSSRHTPARDHARRPIGREWRSRLPEVPYPRCRDRRL